MSCGYCSESWCGLGAKRPNADLPSSTMTLSCERSKRGRRHDLAGGSRGAQGAGLGGDGQGVVLTAVGDDGVLVRRLVEGACWFRAVGADQPDLVDLIRLQWGEIVDIEHQDVVL